MSDDYYKLLGVERTATGTQIKYAYRKAARRWHPDKCKAPGAEEMFKRIAGAYACLSDPSRRAGYDLTGREGRAPTVTPEEAWRRAPTVIPEEVRNRQTAFLPFKLNQTVRVRNLVTNTELNGKAGFVRDYDPRTERYTVEIGGKKVLMKMENLIKYREPGQGGTRAFPENCKVRIRGTALTGKEGKIWGYNKKTNIFTVVVDGAKTEFPPGNLERVQKPTPKARGGTRKWRKGTRVIIKRPADATLNEKEGKIWNYKKDDIFVVRVDNRDYEVREHELSRAPPPRGTKRPRPETPGAGERETKRPRTDDRPAGDNLNSNGDGGGGSKS